MSFEKSSMGSRLTGLAPLWPVANQLAPKLLRALPHRVLIGAFVARNTSRQQGATVFLRSRGRANPTTPLPGAGTTAGCMAAEAAPESSAGYLQLVPPRCRLTRFRATVTGLYLVD